MDRSNVWGDELMGIRLAQRHIHNTILPNKTVVILQNSERHYDKYDVHVAENFPASMG